MVCIAWGSLVPFQEPFDLEDFEDDDLIDELERRGLDYNTRGVDADQMRALLEQIWMRKFK